MKLYDTYFKKIVTVIDTGEWTNPQYITGLYYRVEFPDGTILESHESAFTRPWLRKRDNKGKFLTSQPPSSKGESKVKPISHTKGKEDVKS